jgi:hypothetical protein
MESEDEEKDSKAAPAPTIEGEVPCMSPPVDEDNERSDRIKIICDPTTTSMNDATKAQGFLGDDKFAKGEGILQLAAMTELKILGIECDDATKAHSLLCSNQVGASSSAYKAWTDDQVTQLLNLCKSGHCIPKIVDDRVRSRIKDIRIKVLSRGTWKLVTKR